jgi:hypothetical protein
VKFKLSLIIVVCFLTTFYSCSKDQTIENNGLLGKWLLEEIYSGYPNGGDFSWHSLPYDYSLTLEFTTTGQYFSQESHSGDLQQCSGTYQLLPANNLEVNSNCDTAVERMKISELTNRSLIIDRSGFEGVTRYKYSPAK